MPKKKVLKKALAGSAALLLAAQQVPLMGLTSHAETESIPSEDNYARLLQYSMYFYDANMCGDQVESVSRLTWRANCHTNDEVVGGFHDAGDYVMFGLPQGFSASTLGWGYYEFKDAYLELGQASHLKCITDSFCDFFKRSVKMKDGEVTELLYQKGNGAEDHAYWGKPENQTEKRPMYWTADGGSDIAAEYAAALALNYLNFGNQEDLTYAEALYRFSTKYNSNVLGANVAFYNTYSYLDDQAWAAGWLYIATEKESYLEDCWAKQTSNYIFNWEDVSDGASIVLAEITGDWDDAIFRINDRVMNPESYLSGMFCSYNDWGNLRYNCNISLCNLVICKNTYDLDLGFHNVFWSKNQMDYILGGNLDDRCYVVGFDDHSVKNPHYRASSGYDSYDEFNSNREVAPGSPVLYGAMVGGPSLAGGYEDDLHDYQYNEVALDYNAALVGIAAALFEEYGTGELTNLAEEAENMGIKSDYVEKPVFCEHLNTNRDNAQEPTCIKEGYTGDLYCSDCGELIEEGITISMTDHVPNNFRDGAQEPTCWYEGYTGELHCSDCGELIEAGYPISMTDHVPNPYRDYAQEPTCIKEGYTGDLYCSDCGELIEEGITISMTDHVPNNFRDGAQEPTCWYEGYTGNLYCSDCGELIEAGYPISKTDHVPNNFRDDAHEPTCWEEGYTGDLHCSECGELLEKGKPISKTDHVPNQYRDNVQEPTCWYEGYTGDLFCSECGELIEYGKLISMTDHVPNPYRDNAEEPTCWHEGYSGELHCSECGGVIEESKILPKTDHVPNPYRDDAYEPTCWHEGYTGDLYCSECGELIEEGKPISKTDHVPNPYRDDAYEPTCRMEGYTGDLYCSDCGELIEEGKPISKTDHIPNDYRVGAQEPTCWEEGYTGDLYCRECGEIIEWSETIPQIFHEDKDGNGLCDYCSEILDVYFYAEGCAMEFDKAPLMHVYMMFTDEVLNADDSCVRFWLGEDKDKAQEFKLSETPTRDINVSGVGSFRCYDFVVRVPLKDLYTEMHGTLCFDGRELDCLTTTASEYLEAVRDAFPNLNYMVDALLSASRCSAAYFGVSSEDVSWVLNILEEQYDDVTEELAQYYNDDQRSEYAGTSLVLKEELKLRNYYTEKMALKNYTASGEKDGLFYYEYEISYSDLKMDCDGHSALEYIYKALKFSDDEYMKAVAFSLYDMYLKFNW